MKKIIVFISKLLEETQSLLNLKRDLLKYTGYSGHDKRRDEYVRKTSRWLRNIYQVLTYGELKQYLMTINNILYKDPLAITGDQIAFVAGVLESAHECLIEGFVGKLKFLIHAEMFDSLLDQADSLLNSGHKIPSAVLGRIVIERWLRDQAEKAEISNWDTAKA